MVTHMQIPKSDSLLNIFHYWLLAREDHESATTEISWSGRLLYERSEAEAEECSHVCLARAIKSAARLRWCSKIFRSVAWHNHQKK